MPEDAYSLHREPVWRSRSNFIINAPLPEFGRFEQLWVRQLDGNRFSLCCIPFFLYDIALHDVVETRSTGSYRHLLSRVVESSGRYVFRVFFERQRGQYRYRDGTVAALSELGALHEWSSPSLLAVDAADQEAAQRVADCLQAGEDSNWFVYETGKSI